MSEKSPFVYNMFLCSYVCKHRKGEPREELPLFLSTGMCQLM